MPSDPRRRPLPGSSVLVILLAAIAAAPLAEAQLATGGGGGPDRIEGKAKLLPIPYVDYDRSLGFAIGFIPVVLFNPVASDTLSPSSAAGAFAMYTENETWFLAGFTLLYLDEDRWRVTGAGGTGSVNFQFYLKDPIDVWLPYNTAADFGYLGLERRTWRDVFVGASYVYTRFDTEVEEVPGTFGTGLHGIGLKGSLDRRSSVYYPRGGFFTNAELTSYPSGLGNDFESNVVELDFNHYAAFREHDVLASRAYAGIGIGDVSFNQQFIVGRIDLRGYTQGEFRGNNVLAVQTEYRWNFRPRFGLVGFGGLATVLDAINEDDDGRLLPAVGTGFRFTADTETNMNVGMDVAVGDGDWGVYFRLGEAY